MKSTSCPADVRHVLSSGRGSRAGHDSTGTPAAMASSENDSACRRRERVRGPKWVWALVIVFVNYIGPIIYFVAGRRDE